MNASSQPPSRQFSDQALVLVPLYVTIFLLAVVGNSLVMVTLQNKRMRTPMNILLLNLAISDLLLGVVCMPFTLTGFLLRDFIFGAILCRVIPYVQAVSVSVSAYTLVTISFERYFGICYPLKTRHWRSLSHAYKMISVVWVSSFVFIVPVAITSELQPVGDSGRNKCREVWPSKLGEQIFNMYLDIILLIVPLCVMVTLYSKICKALWQHIINERDMESSIHSPFSTTYSTRGQTVVLAIPSSSSLRRTIPHSQMLKGLEISKESNRKESTVETFLDNSQENEIVGIKEEKVEQERCSFGSKLSKQNDNPFTQSKNNKKSILRKTNTKKSLESKKRVIKMLFAVVLEFFICWTPLYVINTISLFDPPAVYGVLGMGGISAFQLLAYCSSCCNPITYCFMNASFRRAFLSAVCWKRNTSQCCEGVVYSNK